MIGLLEEQDRKTVVDIWTQAFGDTQDYIYRFFNLSGATTYVYRENGLVLGFVNLLDVTVNEKKGGYVFALAVDEKYRGRGIGSKLLEYVDITLTNNGYSFAIVIPEPYNKLKQLYCSCGFDDEIYLFTTQFKKAEQTKDFRITKASAEETFNAWQTRKNTVCHSKEFFRYVYADLIDEGSRFVKVDCNGQSAFCVCYPKEKCVIIKEVSNCESLDDISQAVMHMLDVDKAIYVSSRGDRKYPYALLKKYEPLLDSELYANFLLDGFVNRL